VLELAADKPVRQRSTPAASTPDALAAMSDDEAEAMLMAELEQGPARGAK